MTVRENARLVLHTVSGETAPGRAARRAAEDVLRLENVRAAATWLADEAARACTEPQRFHANEDGRQQKLSRLVALTRLQVRVSS